MLAKHHPYSTLKAAWHLDRIQKMREDKLIVPVELQIILSDLCNQDCHWCAYRATNGLSVQNFGEQNEDGTNNKNPNRMLNTEKVFEILYDAASLGVKSIIWTGGGEPTVHPDHLELFRTSMDLGLEASLNTNGVTLRTGWQDVLPRMAYVRFSIDAGNAGDYARDRGVSRSQYDRAIANLTLLCNEVQQQNSDCVVGAGYVVTPYNITGILEGVQRIKDTGVKYIRMASMQSTKGLDVYFADTWERANETVQEAKDSFEDENFSVISMTEEAMGKKPDYTTCGFQEFVTYIGADLNIYRCCYTAYTDLGEIGSLKDQTLREWFESAQFSKAMYDFDARSCDTCPLDGKNQTILYMIDKSPTHVNFV